MGLVYPCFTDEEKEAQRISRLSTVNTASKWCGGALNPGSSCHKLLHQVRGLFTGRYGCLGGAGTRSRILSFPPLPSMVSSAGRARWKKNKNKNKKELHMLREGHDCSIYPGQLRFGAGPLVPPSPAVPGRCWRPREVVVAEFALAFSCLFSPVLSQVAALGPQRPSKPSPGGALQEGICGPPSLGSKPARQGSLQTPLLQHKRKEDGD